MDYADLVEAIKNQDEVKTSNYLKILMPRLVKFLRLHMGASKSDAQDCAQQAFLYALEAIKTDQLRDVDKLPSYLLTVCRNNFLKKTDHNAQTSFVDSSIHGRQPPRQLANLLRKERTEILKECLEELSDDYREFIIFWFNHPDANAEKAAQHFNISVNNAWTRKHRVIKKLRECYKQKSDL